MIDEKVRRTLELAPGDLDEMGFFAKRQWSDGRWIALEPMSFGRVRLGISALIASEPDLAFVNGYADVWEFPTKEIALDQFTAWEGVGEPQQWSRHPLTCRRRQEDGSATVRVRELPHDLLAQLRHAVADGAPHDCNEWWGEQYSPADGRCILCDRMR